MSPLGGKFIVASVVSSYTVTARNRMRGIDVLDFVLRDDNFLSRWRQHSHE